MAVTTQDRGDEQAPHLVIYPGEFFFGEGAGRVQTLLGSCVGATFWHPQRRLGGLCHYLLPNRIEGLASRPLDARYGDEALELIHSAVLRKATYSSDYVVKLFGGGDMFPLLDLSGAATGDTMLIGERNVAVGRKFLGEHGFILSAQDVGGSGYRVISLDLQTGDVSVRYRAVGPDKEHRLGG